MGKTRVKNINSILCSRGVTYLNCGTFSVVYKYRPWILQLNPVLIPLPLRKGHRRLIIVDGKKRGWCEMRFGMIPLERYILGGKGISRSILRFVRKYIGIGLQTWEKGYIFAGIGRYRYVITKRISDGGLCICEVFDKHTNHRIGDIVFNKEFSEAYIRTSLNGVIKTLCTLAGYVADSLLYGRAASALESVIKIIF